MQTFRSPNGTEVSTDKPGLIAYYQRAGYTALDAEPVQAAEKPLAPGGTVPRPSKPVRVSESVTEAVKPAKKAAAPRPKKAAEPKPEA